MITELKALELNDELYTLRDSMINLLFKDKCILNKTHETKTHSKNFSREAKQYYQFCSIYGFKQLINSPTRITGNTSTLIDHFLTNAHDVICQSGVNNTAISDHNMMYFPENPTSKI